MSSFVTPSLSTLCLLGKVEVVRAVLERGKHEGPRGGAMLSWENVNYRISENQTVLMQTALMPSEEHVSILRVLLEQPSIEVNLKDDEGLTALHLATRCRNIEAVKLLLADQRVDVNCKASKRQVIDNVPYDQITPLMMAASNAENFDIFKLLMSEQRIDVNCTSPYGGGTTVLMSSSLHYNVKAARILLEDPRVDVNWMNSMGLSGLHAAADPRCNAKIMELFLAHPRVDVNCKNGPLGETVLHWAVATNNLGAVKLILAEPSFTSANALVELKTNIMSTAVRMAASQCHWEILKELVHHPSVDLDAKDKNGVGVDVLAR